MKLLQMNKGSIGGPRAYFFSLYLHISLFIEVAVNFQEVKNLESSNVGLIRENDRENVRERENENENTGAKILSCNVLDSNLIPGTLNVP